MQPRRPRLLLAGILALPFLLTLSTLSQTRISILFTSDLHSTLLPRTVVSHDGRLIESGGYARLASAIRREILHNPAATMVFDGGDFSMGTIFSALFMTEGPELRLMGDMGYDAVTLGNHEFDYHLDGLARDLNSARAHGHRMPQLVISNFRLNGSDTGVTMLATAFRNAGVKESIVLERQGIRIGVFGLMGKDAADDAPFVSPASFDDRIAAARRVVHQLMDSAGVGMVVCLSHAGTTADPENSEDIRLAREVPGIDVIVSGHTHRSLSQPIRVGNAIIGSSGAFGAYLGSMDIEVSPHQRPRLVRYRLIPIDASVHADSSIATIIRAFQQDVDSTFLFPLGIHADQVIAESDFDFESLEYAYAHPGEIALGDLIADAYRFAVDEAEGRRGRPVDVVIAPLGLIRGSLKSSRGNTTAIRSQTGIKRWWTRTRQQQGCRNSRSGWH